MHIIGDVENKNAIIVDDIIDTAGSITETVKALKENGAKKVFAACTHGIFSGQAIDRINSSLVDKVYVSDTIPLSKEKLKSGKIEVLSVSKLFAQAIDSIYKETSVSKLFLQKR
jgi:ribose-phosphate pyrophosphokinase